MINCCATGLGIVYTLLQFFFICNSTLLFVYILVWLPTNIRIQEAMKFVTKYGADKVRLLEFVKNRGKGGAVRMVSLHWSIISSSLWPHPPPLSTLRVFWVLVEKGFWWWMQTEQLSLSTLNASRKPWTNWLMTMYVRHLIPSSTIILSTNRVVWGWERD